MIKNAHITYMKMRLSYNEPRQWKAKTISRSEVLRSIFRYFRREAVDLPVAGEGSYKETIGVGAAVETVSEN